MYLNHNADDSVDDDDDEFLRLASDVPGGGDFFPRLRRFLKKVRPFIYRPRFFVCFEVEISSRTLIPLFRQGLVNSGSASLDDCGRVTLTS